MVACDHTNRACRGIDIDPAYVDVAVRRRQQLSGEHARLHGDGHSLATGSAGRTRAVVPPLATAAAAGASAPGA